MQHQQPTRRSERKSVARIAVEQVSTALRVPRLDSIKNRILALAIAGTLLPAGITLGVAYLQNRQAIETKITEDLLSASTQASRASSVWLKEQVYVLRVFAGSEEVMTNLGRYATQGLMSPRLREYLRSLQNRYPDFEQTLVLDAAGRVLATSAQQASPVALPAEWQKTMRQRGRVVGDPYSDAKTGVRKVIVAVPVMRADGQLMGAFAADVSLAPVSALLRSYAPDSTRGGAYLVTDSGVVVSSAFGGVANVVVPTLLRSTLEELRNADSASVEFASFDEREVIGSLEPVAEAPWAVLAEVTTDSAFGEIRRFRAFALSVVFVLLLIVAWTAYRLGAIIVRPLEQLALGATQVGMGGLDVDLPTDNSAGEVSALARVFNHMVARLRAGRQELAGANDALRHKNEELERLSVTDGLTGLTNHRALMQRLAEEGQRAQRSEKPFVVIMADVDHFKQYNDEFGHPAGDEVLKKVAAILKECTRTVDCVARYGGEEFAVLLPETDMGGALEVAERMRARVEKSQFPGRRITLSLGLAEFPRDADEVKSVIKVADSALYVAKREGRNQVAQAKQAAKKQKLPTARESKAVRKSAATKAVATKPTKNAKRK